MVVANLKIWKDPNWAFLEKLLNDQILGSIFWPYFVYLKLLYLIVYPEAALSLYKNDYSLHIRWFSNIWNTFNSWLHTWKITQNAAICVGLLKFVLFRGIVMTGKLFKFEVWIIYIVNVLVTHKFLTNLCCVFCVGAGRLCVWIANAIFFFRWFSGEFGLLVEKSNPVPEWK